MKRILVVDDSPSARSFLVNVLQSEGYAVSAAENAREGLQLEEETAFDLILTDINMPEMNGFEFIEQTRSKPNYESTPILIVSSGKEDLDKRRGFEAGANLYVTKPVDPRFVLDSLEILTSN